MFPSQYHLKILHSEAFSTTVAEPVFSLVYEHGTSIPTGGRDYTSFPTPLCWCVSHPPHYPQPPSRSLLAATSPWHYAKTRRHFPPQLKGEAGTICITSCSVPFNKKNKKCTVFIWDTITLIFSFQNNFPIYETIILDFWNNENPSICLHLY